jgi:hypothetical protein
MFLPGLISICPYVLYMELEKLFPQRLGVHKELLGGFLNEICLVCLVP